MTRDTMQPNANGPSGPDVSNQPEEAKLEEASEQSRQSQPDSAAHLLKRATPSRMPLFRH